MTGRDLIEDLKNIKTGIDEVKKSTEANTRAEQTNTNSIKNQIANMKKAYNEGKLSNDLKKTSTDLLKNMTDAISDQIQTIENNTIKTKAMRDEEKILKEQLDEVIQGYEFLYDDRSHSRDGASGQAPGKCTGRGSESAHPGLLFHNAGGRLHAGRCRRCARCKER